jgi:sugar (pentulose or hexulose) kinase
VSPYLLGIDSGLTVTKAVVFDEEGREIGVGAANNVHLSPHPRWVKQDMDKVWEKSLGHTLVTRKASSRSKPEFRIPRPPSSSLRYIWALSMCR